MFPTAVLCSGLRPDPTLHSVEPLSCCPVMAVHIPPPSHRGLSHSTDSHPVSFAPPCPGPHSHCPTPGRSSGLFSRSLVSSGTVFWNWAINKTLGQQLPRSLVPVTYPSCFQSGSDDSPLSLVASVLPPLNWTLAHPWPPVPEGLPGPSSGPLLLGPQLMSPRSRGFNISSPCSQGLSILSA